MVFVNADFYLNHLCLLVNKMPKVYIVANIKSYLMRQYFVSLKECNKMLTVQIP